LNTKETILGIIKFKTSSAWSTGPKIERVEVIRETEQSVFLPKSRVGKTNGERRAAKHSEWEQYHDTWEAARAYLLEIANDDVTAARLALERANGKLGNIKGMKKPEGA
jgi:hypothetical protein